MSEKPRFAQWLQVKQFVACVKSDSTGCRFMVFRTGDDKFYLFAQIVNGILTGLNFPVAKANLQDNIRKALANGVGNCGMRASEDGVPFRFLPPGETWVRREEPQPINPERDAGASPQESPTMPEADPRLAAIDAIAQIKHQLATALREANNAHLRWQECQAKAQDIQAEFDTAWSALVGSAAPPAAPPVAPPVTLSPLAAQSAPPGTVMSLDGLHGLTAQQLNRTHLPSLFAQQIARPISVTPVILHGNEWVCVSLTDTTWELRPLFPRPQWQATYQREWDMQSRLEDLPPRDPENTFAGLLISTIDGDRVVGFAPGLTLSSAPGAVPAQPASRDVEEAPAKEPKKRGARRKKPEPEANGHTLDNLLRASLLPDDEAIARWTAHRQQGLPDGLLLASIAAEWGCGGSLDYGKEGQCCFQGVPEGNPAFWAGQLTREGAPALEGAALVEAVRRALGIANPSPERAAARQPTESVGELDLFSQERKEGAA